MNKGVLTLKMIESKEEALYHVLIVSSVQNAGGEEKLHYTPF